MSNRNPWIMTAEVISTGHLTPATRKDIDEHLGAERSYRGIYTIDMDDGWMFFNSEALDSLDFKNMPSDLCQVLRWANDRGYEWVRLDSAADRTEGLPYYGE